MKGSLTTELLWDVIVEQIQTGELKTLPCPEMRSPDIGDVICYESQAEAGIEESSRWVYVEVTGIFDYYRRGSVVPVQGLKLIVFKVIDNLSELSAR